MSIENNSVQEIAALVVADLGNRPTIAQIEKFLNDKNISKTPGFCRQVWRSINSARNSFTQVDPLEIIKRLPHNPRIDDVTRVMRELGHPVTKSQSYKIYTDIKTRFPNLWNVDDIVSYTVRLPRADSIAFEKMVTSLGIKKNDVFITLIRTFLLAAARSPTNLSELITKSRTLSKDEYIYICKLLGIDIADPARVQQTPTTSQHHKPG